MRFSRRARAVIVSIVLGASALGVPTLAPSALAGAAAVAAPVPTDIDPLAQQVLDHINNARAAEGLPPYTMNAGLVAAARLHNQAMAAGCGLSHQCPDEPGLGDRISAQGVSWRAAGENCGVGGPVPATDNAIVAMAIRLNQSMLDEVPPDDGHRQNLLSKRFRQVGIDILRDSSGQVWLTQDFTD